jgi:hypothetical protein
MAYPSSFPGALDTFPTNRQLKQVIAPDDINGAFDALNKIEAVLGGARRRSFAYYTGHLTPQLSDYSALLGTALDDLTSGGRYGVLELPDGVWPILSTVNWRSRAFLAGMGADASVLDFQGSNCCEVIRFGYSQVTGGVYVDSGTVTQFGMRDVSLKNKKTTDWAGGPRFDAGSSWGWFENVRVTQANGFGWYFGNNVHHIFGRGLVASDIVATSDLRGGVGFWHFHNPSDVILSDCLGEDLDGHGITYDAGSTELLGVAPHDNVAANILIRNFGRNLDAGYISAQDGVLFEGGQRNRVSARVVAGATTNARANGLHFAQDQVGLAPDDNTVDIVVEGCGGHGILLQGGSRNAIRAKIHNVGMGGTTKRVVYIQDSTQNGVIASALDNDIEVEHIQDSGIGLNDFAVRIDIGSGGTVKRNRIYGRLRPGSVGFLNTNGSPTMTGVDANRILTTETDDVSDGVGLPFGAALDIWLRREAAGVLSQRAATQAQQHHLYKTFTDASNYGRLELGYDGSNFVIQVRGAGTGANPGTLLLGTLGANAIRLNTNNVNRWLVDANGHLLGATDGSFDIGAAGATRPRNIFASGGIVPFVKAGAPVDGDFTNPTNGMIAIDSTNSKIYVRIGGVWKGVVVA